MARQVLINARLIDGESMPRTGMTIVIDGHRISGIFQNGQQQLQPSDVVHDLRGRTVMPGMVIGHYHATYEGIGLGSPPVGMEAAPALQTIRAVRNLEKALMAGFTSVISAGAPYGIDASCKRAIDEGLIQGPRVMAGSRDVSTTGHLQDCFFQWHWGPGMGPQTNIVDGPDAFRRAIREEVKRGAEIIKIFASTGHGLPPARYSMELSEDELAAAISAAHERGVKVRAHLARKDAILAAVRLGMDVVDHGDGLDQECIDLMLEKGTFLVPSLYFPHRVLQTSQGPATEEMRSDLGRMLDIVPRANELGLKMVLGDDYGATPLAHGEYGGEPEFYVKEVGIPALDVLRWATRNGAAMMGMGAELGVLKPGYLADLLVVNGDPLADMGLLKSRDSLLAIVKDGAFVKNELDVSAQAPGTPSRSRPQEPIVAA